MTSSTTAFVNDNERMDPAHPRVDGRGGGARSPRRTGLRTCRPMSRRANTVRVAAGFVKLICETRHGLLLGAHLVGPDASELLPELTRSQKWDLTVHDLARNVHTHPTLSEAVQEATHGLAGHMINF
jgi:hypothetical protein